MKTFNAALGIGRRAARIKQAGVATILVILMIGVGVVAVSVGTLHTIRNTQERQLAAHAQVNAQAGAWAAVEAVRVFLGTLSGAQLAGLNTNVAWSIEGTDGLTQSAVIKSVVAPTAPSVEYKVTAEIGAIATAGQSSSTVEVVYAVSPGSAPGNTKLTGTLDFYNDLVMSGGITLKTPGVAGISLNVDGDFDASSISIGGTGLERVAVTGNLTIGSNVNAVELRARNVVVNGGSYARRVYAFGDPDGPGGVGTDAPGDTCCGAIINTGGTGITNAYANGWVKSGGGGISQIDALRWVEVTRGGTTHDVINAGGYVTNTQGGTIKTAINAVGNVTLAGSVDMSKGTVSTKGNLSTSGSNVKQANVLGKVEANTGTLSNLHSGGDVQLNTVTTTKIQAVGNITCDQSYMEYPSLIAGGTISKCQPSWDSTSLRPNHKPNQKVDAPTVNVNLIPRIPPVQLERPVIDAWALRAQANYAIEIIDGQLMARVSNVNGVADALYHVKKRKATAGSNSEREYLCLTLENGECTQPVAPFCSGQSSQNSCFEFTAGINGARDKITILGLRLPPGVIWVKGDLHVTNGVFYNTFIATGNVTTGGSLKVYALNFAAAYKNGNVRKNAVCKNEFASPEQLFNGMYPTNFCDNGGVYTPKSIGNIGFLAGGYNPDDNPTEKVNYSGGDIALGSSNYVYGTVLAGNILKTGGQTYIAGYVSAAGLEQDPNSTNELGQSTEIDLTDLPESYNPDEIPNMEEGSTGGTGTASVLWTRYI